MAVVTLRTPPGLEGVTVAETALGGVRGDEGFFHYREFSAVELARARSLEDVWFLMHCGRLPDSAELAQFRAEVGQDRHLLPEIADLVARSARVGRDVPALTWVRTAMSLVAQSLHATSWLGGDLAALRRQAMHLAATVPTVLAVGWRARHGEEPIPPDPDLGVATDLLRMLTGEAPNPAHARALEQYLMLTVDHGFNASTFAGRAVVSTGADLGSGVVAALGSLSGPLHGGAPALVLDMLEDIATPDRAAQWIDDALGRGERIMGFGHRVYRTDDPRSVLLGEIARGLGGPVADLAVAVEAEALQALEDRYPDRPIRTNVEYYAGVVLHAIGLPGALFPGCFAVSRVIGWTAHLLEQIGDNRIMRPKAQYVGPPAPAPIPPPG